MRRAIVLSRRIAGHPPADRRVFTKRIEIFRLTGQNACDLYFVEETACLAFAGKGEQVGAKR